MVTRLSPFSVVKKSLRELVVVVVVVLCTVVVVVVVVGTYGMYVALISNQDVPESAVDGAPANNNKLLGTTLP
jgi:VIT1/CCC1 family predicted Fe2+/Mn2+ transporter